MKDVESMTSIADWKTNWGRYLARFVHKQHSTSTVSAALVLLKLVANREIGCRAKYRVKVC
jgi:hypothetical protein